MESNRDEEPEEETQKRRADEGASQLVGLFAPPPTATVGDPSLAATTTPAGAANEDAAAAPRSQANQTTISTVSTQLRERDGETRSAGAIAPTVSTNIVSSQTGGTTSSSLAGLFITPPTPTSPPSATTPTSQITNNTITTPVSTNKVVQTARGPPVPESLSGLFAPPPPWEAQHQQGQRTDSTSTPGSASPIAKNSDSQGQQETSSSLTGLLPPPPALTTQQTEVRGNVTSSPGRNHTSPMSKNNASQGREAVALTGLFAPPSSATQQQQLRKNDLSTNRDRLSSSESPKSPSRKGAPSLAGLFAPPPPRRESADVEDSSLSVSIPASSRHSAVTLARTHVGGGDAEDETMALLSHSQAAALAAMFAEEDDSSSPSAVVSGGALRYGADDAEYEFAAAKASHSRGGPKHPAGVVSFAPGGLGGSPEEPAQQPPSRLDQFIQEHLQPTTGAGALMFLLYHVVFCLANASAIIRPHSSGSILGVMAKTSCIGILFSGPFYVYRLGGDIPALYPSIDLFLAPFLAEAAAVVDESLAEQYASDNGTSSYPDTLFFGSFAVLTAIGMFLAGLFLLLAATFKLANLGTFLPFSVLCGFFSAVGVLLWALAFSVDTSGKTWKAVFFSGDLDLILDSLMHHVPSLVVGILMNRLGPKNPFFVILLIIATQTCFYVYLLVSGTTLEEAQQAKWFWSREELVYDKSDSLIVGFQSWTLPPAPFGSFGAMFAGHVNWTAVQKGLGHMAALAFLYLLRSSIHASAMKKNVGNLVRRIPNEDNKKQDIDEALDHAAGPGGGGGPNHRRRHSVADSVRLSVQIVNMSLADSKSLRWQSKREEPSNNGDARAESIVLEATNDRGPEYTEIRAKPSRKTLEEIFVEYGYALFVVAGCGGFGVCPTVATSNTMYAIGAEHSAPQYLSILLLLIFYLTDFELVRFIPKTAFSSLLVLGSVDTLVVWFIQPFSKMLDITEWLVVPIIVGFSLFVGFLNAVFLGIFISLFIFVASFFRIGVVKFNATGLEIRSRIERSMAQSAWLDDNGDAIQVLVLQNYLMFGNANSVLNYVSTMFEEVDETESQRLDFSLPPMPSVLVIDLSLITGMDSTSTADVFADIKELCSTNDCKLFLCGLSPRMRKGLALGGVKPSRGPRAKSVVKIFSDLDTALGKAEDTLIQNGMVKSADDSRLLRTSKTGFQYALEQIDELHGREYTAGLLDLEPFTAPLELEAGQILYEHDGGVVPDNHRGLFFIESGLLKIEKDSSQSLTMTRTRSGHNLFQAGTTPHTLKHQHARMGSIARRASLVKASMRHGAGAGPQHFRLARIGPGWVCGALENASGLRPSGITIAVTKCRLHHLPFRRLEEIEKDDPLLVLRLYKMLSHLMAHREEITIEQLTTLHNIMSSPAHSKPISRAALRAMS